MVLQRKDEQENGVESFFSSFIPDSRRKYLNYMGKKENLKEIRKRQTGDRHPEALRDVLFWK